MHRQPLPHSNEGYPGQTPGFEPLAAQSHETTETAEQLENREAFEDFLGTAMRLIEQRAGYARMSDGSDDPTWDNSTRKVKMQYERDPDPSKPNETQEERQEVRWKDVTTKGKKEALAEHLAEHLKKNPQFGLQIEERIKVLAANAGKVEEEKNKRHAAVAKAREELATVHELAKRKPEADMPRQPLNPDHNPDSESVQEARDAALKAAKAISDPKERRKGVKKLKDQFWDEDQQYAEDVKNFTSVYNRVPNLPLVGVLRDIRPHRKKQKAHQQVKAEYLRGRNEIESRQGRVLQMKTSIRETAIPKAEAGDRQLAVSLRRVESLQEVFDLAKQKAGVKIPKTPGDPEKWDDDLVTGRSRELEERLEAYHKVLNKHLLEWRRTGDDFDEQRFVNQLATNSNYLEHYREAVRNMPKTDKRHEQMVQMRNMLSGINNAYTYRYMQQNFENAVARGLDGSGQPNFDGRIPVIHTKDGGLRKQGNDIIYYPDGSTATITVNRQGIEVVQPRVDAAGQYIESQAPVSFAREQIEEAKQMKRQAQAWARGVVSRINTTSFTTKQLENEYEKITTQLLLKPTDANRVRAEAYASATFRRAEAELARERAKAEKTKKKIIARAAGSWALGSMIGFEGGAINRIPPYVEDQEKRRIVNVYEYRTRYHAITPGAKQKPGSPYLGPDGEVIVPLDKRNSGRWIYYPDGSRVLRNR